MKTRKVIIIFVKSIFIKILMLIIMSVKMCFFVISLARFVFECDFSLMTVVEKCPWNMTGADFYALSSEALLNAVKRKIALLQAGKNNGLYWK